MVTTKKISQLPVGQTPNNADQLVLLQAGQTVRVTASQMRDYMGIPEGGFEALVFDVIDDDSVILPAGAYVSSIIITGDGAVKVGTTANGGELVEDTVSASSPLIYAGLPNSFSESSRTIHFTGTAKYRLAIWQFGE